MGSSVRIFVDKEYPDKTALWMSNSGIFWDTMQGISETLLNLHPNIAHEVKLFRDNPISYADMTQWNSDKMNLFLKGVILIENRIIQEYIELEKVTAPITTTNALKLILHFDARTTEAKHYLGEGKIIIRDGQHWRAKGWIYDYVLIKILSSAHYDMLRGYGHKDSEFLSSIQKAHQTGIFNLSQLNREQHRTIIGLFCHPLSFSKSGAIYGQLGERLKSDIQQSATSLVDLYEAEYPQHIQWWETGEE